MKFPYSPVSCFKRKEIKSEMKKKNFIQEITGKLVGRQEKINNE
jgi:hypothetical protein